MYQHAHTTPQAARATPSCLVTHFPCHASRSARHVGFWRHLGRPPGHEDAYSARPNW